jgi:hypothetical protein
LIKQYCYIAVCLVSALNCLDGERPARQLSGVKQPPVRRAGAAEFDPSATSAAHDCCCAM